MSTSSASFIADRNATFCFATSEVYTILLITALALLCAILWRFIYNVQWNGLIRSRGIDEAITQADTTGNSESKILAEVELKLLEFKRQHELKTDNKILKSQVSLLAEEKELNKQKIKELKADNSSLKETLTKTERKYEREVNALKEELCLQDKKVFWFQNRLQLTQRKLQESKKELEESSRKLTDTRSELELSRERLEQERRDVELIKMRLDETRKQLFKEEYQRKLIEKDLQRTVAQNEKELEARLNVYFDVMRQNQKELESKKQKIS